MRELRTSLRLNNDVPVGEFVELARLAEDVGFDQIWISNDLFLRSAPVLLAAAATATSTISLGTCILNPYSMHPAEIAMAAATLDELSDGRFLLGLAAGAGDFLGWIGIEQQAPLRRTREAVVAIRALLAGDDESLRDGGGSGWGAEARMRIPTRPVPIYVGAMSPRMRGLIGEVADGGLPLLYPPEAFTDAAADVAGGCEHAGRDLADVDLAACVWVSVDDDAAAARRPLADKLAYFAATFPEATLARVGVEPADVASLRELPPDEAARQMPPGLLDLGIHGTPADVADRCRTLIESGVTHLSFGPPLGPVRADAIRTLGDVITRLRG